MRVTFSEILTKKSNSLANLSEGDAGVGGGDLFAVDDLGLLEPLVTLGELDGLAVRGLVAKLGKGLKLLPKAAGLWSFCCVR